jgi:hypothetical protein
MTLYPIGGGIGTLGTLEGSVDIRVGGFWLVALFECRQIIRQFGLNAVMTSKWHTDGVHAIVCTGDSQHLVFDVIRETLVKVNIARSVPHDV